MMKIVNYITILTLTLTFFGCEELVNGDGDININPNNPTTTGYESILITAEVGQIILQTGETARRGGIFAGTHTGIDRQHQGFTAYTLTNPDFDDLWDDAFINAYRNAKLAEDRAREQGITGVTTGITQTLQALSLGTAASHYGDIPFDELYDPEFENPQFESQDVVYGKIQSLLDEAISNLQSGTGRPASGSEVFFDGDPDAWLEVAYTLKARCYMHTGEYANAYSAAQNGIASFESSLYAPHGDALTTSNLNWQFFANGTRGPDLVVSDFMVSFLIEDPAENPIAGNYRGHAKTDENARYNYMFENNSIGFQPNQADGNFAGQTTAAPMVTYQENLLILAESGLRSADFATGLGHLNQFRSFMDNGGYINAPDVTALTYDAFVEADFQNGGIENANNISQNDALLREILEERYITLFGQPEVFNDTRRTQGDGNARVRVQPNVGDELPQRFLYPQSELQRNENAPDPAPGLFDNVLVFQ